MKFSMDRLISAINSGNATKSMSFSVSDRSALACHRDLKKALASDFVSGVPKDLRNNGTLEIDSLFYVGWFKPKGPDPIKTGKIGHKKRSLLV